MFPPQALLRVPKAEEIIPTINNIIARIQSVYDNITQDVSPSTACFDNVVKPLSEVDNVVQGELGMVLMLFYTTPDQKIHDASVEAKKLYEEAKAEWAGREDVYRLLKAVSEKNEPVDRESKLWLKQELLEYTCCGHGSLSGEQIELYLKKRTEIASLCTKFTSNLSAENGGLWFAEEELDGLPSEQLTRWKDARQMSDSGQVFVPFGNGGTQNVLRFANSPQTRQKMFVGNGSKLSHSAPLFREVVIQRDAQARLLGCPSHAAFRMEKMVAKSTKWVDDFLRNLRDGFSPRNTQVLEQLQHRRIQDLKERGALEEDKAASFPPWDVSYYTRLVQQEEQQVDHGRISEFYPLETTLTGMLGIFSSYLQLRFSRIPPEELGADLIWHEDVQVFSVWDERTESLGFVGYLYLDLPWRDLKYGGFQNVNIQCGYAKPDDSRQYPSTLLNCCFDTATPESPALLKHNEVVLLFHELGHGIHDLVSQTKYVRHHGTRLADDFCESPSILLENWTWLKDVLKRLSCHYTTLVPRYLEKWRQQHPGEPDPPKEIPDELLDSLLKQRNTERMQRLLFTLLIAIFDMKIHNPSTHEELLQVDFPKLWYDLRADLHGVEMPELVDYGYPYTTFPHLMGGYDAGFYGYLSAEAFAQDIFRTFFASAPGDQESWERYRRGILQYGGSHGDELKMLEEFLGRPTNVDALLESLN